MKFTRFSRWQEWRTRDELEDLHFPGVYAIAISQKDLSGKAFAWQPQIVYFGMTNSVAGLKGRLKQFDNTINGKTGHGGAERFRHDFPRSSGLQEQLYVAVAVFKCKVTSNVPSDLLKMGSVAKAEYECFAKFVELFGHLPKYNDKRNSPKFDKVVIANHG